METMNSEENYMVSDFEIDNKRIGDIDLGMVAIYSRILDRFVNSEDIAAVQKTDGGEESPEGSMKSLFLNFLMCDSAFYVERQIALRMMFDSILSTPKHIAKAEKRLGLRLTNIETE